MATESEGGLMGHIYDKQLETFYNSWSKGNLPGEFSNILGEAQEYRMTSSGSPSETTWTLQNLTTGETNEYVTCNGTCSIAIGGGSTIDASYVDSSNYYFTWTSVNINETNGIWTSDGRWLTGDVALLRYYDRELTPEEIAESYKEFEPKEEVEAVFTQLRVDIVNIEPAEEWQPRSKMN